MPQNDSAQPVLAPLCVGVHGAQTDQHESDTKHSVNSEQGGVSVQGRGVQTLHVVESDRRIDHEAEEAGAHHVPESHGNEEVDGPFVALHPGRQTPRRRSSIAA